MHVLLTEDPNVSYNIPPVVLQLFIKMQKVSYTDFFHLHVALQEGIEISRTVIEFNTVLMTKHLESHLHVITNSLQFNSFLGTKIIIYIFIATIKHIMTV